jgi:hypothetical protein
MNKDERVCAFADDLDRLVRRYAEEFDITAASTVGILFMKAHLLCANAVNNYNDDDDDDETL